MHSGNIIAKIFQDSSVTSISKGTILIRPSEPISSAFFLESGEVRMYGISEEGQEATLHIFKSGVVIPMMIIISEMENKYYFEAFTSLTIRKMPVNTLLPLIKSNPDVLYAITKNFAQGIMGLSKRIESLLFLKSQGKVASLLLYLSERFGKSEENNITIPIKLTHLDIASWLGIARETVSRQIENLSKQKIIVYKENKIEIKLLEKLKQIANESEIISH